MPIDVRVSSARSPTVRRVSAPTERRQFASSRDTARAPIAPRCAPRAIARATPRRDQLTTHISYHSSRADVEEFYAQCDPDKENLCLYGNPDGTWEVQLPAEEVPPELPEPALGINFARDGMQVRDIFLHRAPLDRARSRSSSARRAADATWTRAQRPR